MYLALHQLHSGGNPINPPKCTRGLVTVVAAPAAAFKCCRSSRLACLISIPSTKIHRADWSAFIPLYSSARPHSITYNLSQILLDHFTILTIEIDGINVQIWLIWEPMHFMLTWHLLSVLATRGNLSFTKNTLKISRKISLVMLYPLIKKHSQISIENKLEVIDNFKILVVNWIFFQR